MNTTSLFKLAPLAIAVAACRPPAPASTTAAVIEMAQESQLTQLVGEGRLSAAPEYIELRVRITSECFETPAAAVAAADRATAEVKKLLERFADKGRHTDGVFTSGGFTRPFYRSYRGVESCKDTFQKTSTVTLKTSRVNKFPTSFAELQRRVLQGALAKPTGPLGGKALTYASMDEPVPQLTHQTRERLEREAMAMAVTSAKEKLAAVSSIGCKDIKPKIVKFVEFSPSAGRPIPYAATAGSRPSSGTVEFEEIWINKLLEVHFTFDRQKCG